MNKFAVILPVDSLGKEVLSQKLSRFSNLSVDQLLSTITDGIYEIGLKIVIALVIYFAGRWAIRYIIKLVRKILERRNVDVSLRTFSLSLVRITLYIFLVISIVGVLGIDTTSLVALFASAGLAVGMAMSGTLQNFAGGVIILVLKPFKVGDFIEALGQSGTVKDIYLFNTVLNTPDNKTIYVPNGGISTGIINNYSREKYRRLEWMVSMAYGNDYDLAKETLTELLNNEARINHKMPRYVALSSLADSSVKIVVRAWVKTEDYWDVYYEINEKVYKTFPSKGLDLPFPQLDVRLHQ